uniref:Uncharacterized protein n=1 Tax=Arundo donax TaxID=35708 RepID=A0A0A9FHJ2_ARUDO
MPSTIRIGISGNQLLKYPNCSLN